MSEGYAGGITLHIIEIVKFLPSLLFHLWLLDSNLSFLLSYRLDGKLTFLGDLIN